MNRKLGRKARPACLGAPQRLDWGVGSCQEHLATAAFRLQHVGNCKDNRLFLQPKGCDPEQAFMEIAH